MLGHFSSYFTGYFHEKGGLGSKEKELRGEGWV